MIVIRANTPDQVLEQTILSLLQQAQIEAEQITFCAKKKLELPGLVIDNTRHEISANGRNISLTRLESDLLWVLAVCEGTTLSKKELFDAVWGNELRRYLKSGWQYRFQSPKEAGILRAGRMSLHSWWRVCFSLRSGRAGKSPFQYCPDNGILLPKGAERK